MKRKNEFKRIAAGVLALVLCVAALMPLGCGTNPEETSPEETTPVVTPAEGTPEVTPPAETPDQSTPESTPECRREPSGSMR